MGLVPAYLRGFETSLVCRHLPCLVVPAYLRGFETRPRKPPLRPVVSFQHTYEGSKLTRQGRVSSKDIERLVPAYLRGFETC